MAKRKTRITGDKAVDFRTVGTDRTNCVLVALKRLSKTGNRQTYAPDKDAVDAIEAAIYAAAEVAIEALRNGYKAETGGFSID